MSTRIIRKLIKLIIPFIVYFSITIELLPRIMVAGRDITSGDIYILIVGDFENNNSFGKQVLKGFETAYKTSNKKHFKYEIVSIDESLVQKASGLINIETNSLISELRKKMIYQISSKNIVAIISANTSQTVTACLELGNTFNIPVLVTVATRKSVTSSFPNITFRLLPDNSKQAKAIVKWMSKKFPDNSSEFGVLYSPTFYGRDLLESLRKLIGFEKIIPFSISTTTDIAGALRYGMNMNIDSWIALAYQQESIEIYLKKKHMFADIPILFSDGAYGDWIKELNSKSEKYVYLSFPLTYRGQKMRSNIIDIESFGVFGYDACKLLIKIFESTKISNRLSLIEALKETDIQEANNMFIGRYKFMDGENVYSDFEVYEIETSIP